MLTKLVMIQTDDTELSRCQTNYLQQTKISLENVRRNVTKVSSLLQYVRECREENNMPIGEYVAFEEHLDTHTQFLNRFLDIFSAPMNWETNPYPLINKISILIQHVNDLKDITVSAQKLIQHPNYRSAILDVINYQCSYWMLRKVKQPAHWAHFLQRRYLEGTLGYECLGLVTGIVTKRNERHEHNTIVSNLIKSIPETQQFIHDMLTSFIECTDLVNVELIGYNGYTGRDFNLVINKLKQAVNEYTTDVNKSAEQHNFLSNTTAWPHQWAVKCKIPNSNDMEELKELLKST